MERPARITGAAVIFAAGIAVTATEVAASTPATSLQVASGAGLSPPSGGTVQDPNVQVSLDGGSSWTSAFAADSSGRWPAPLPGSRWDTPTANRNQVYGDPQDIYYRVIFTLTRVAPDRVLTGRMAADDQPIAVLLNGTKIASYTETSWAYDPSPHKFSTGDAALFRAGTNTLEFEALNLGGPTAVDFTGAATPAAHRPAGPACPPPTPTRPDAENHSPSPTPSGAKPRTPGPPRPHSSPARPPPRPPTDAHAPAPPATTPEHPKPRAQTAHRPSAICSPG